MPANVRNFWTDVSIDGRSTKLSGGPKAKDGGMIVSLKMRDDGSIFDALSIHAHADDDGALRLIVLDGDHNVVHTVTSHR